LKLIKTYGNIENLLKSGKIRLEENYKEIREIFLKPKVTNNYKLEWKRPDKEGIIRFLCEERDFKRDRVENAIGRLEKLMSYITQRKLSEWFFHT
jgi:flap endonuclease-1